MSKNTKTPQTLRLDDDKKIVIKKPLPPPTPATIRVEIDGKQGEVPRHIYVRAKTNQLREFGYSNLTEEEVDEQITALLEKKTLSNGLTVIGGFMEDEVLTD